MTRILFTALFFLTSAGMVFADPGPATQYLMNEPASLMDLGILRLQRDFSRPWVTATGDKFGVSANFEYKNDKIELIATLATKHLKESEIKASCQDIFAQVKQAVGVNPATGKPVEGEKHSLLGPYYFSHGGYFVWPASDPQGDGIADALDQMTYVSVYVQTLGWRGDGAVGPITLRCKTDLMSTQIFYSTK